MLDVDLEVVLEVLADARQVGDDRDAERREVRRRPDARQLEQLRRVDRAAGEDDLAGLDRARCPPPGRSISTPIARRPSNTTRVTSVRVRTVEVRAGRRTGLQVGPRGAQPAAAVDVPVERPRSPPGGSR